MNGNSWTGRNGAPLGSGARFGLMGILNVTPDSFYDGGKYQQPDAALTQAAILLKSGADILDIGAESTRPGHAGVSVLKEEERLLPVLEVIREKHPSAVISVDTRHADTAARALELGAQVINDVSACAEDPDLLDVLAQYKPGYVLMHGGFPEHPRDARAVLDSVAEFFELNLKRLTDAGLPEDRVALDPGIGFGKNVLENQALLAHVDEFQKIGRPLLIGLSMKTFFGDLLGLPLDERGESTAIASAIIWEKGVFWHRVHNVAQVRNALYLAQALAGVPLAPAAREIC